MAYSPPGLDAFIETRIVRLHGASSAEDIVAALCDVLGTVAGGNTDIARLMDVAKRRAPAIDERAYGCPCGEDCT